MRTNNVSLTVRGAAGGLLAGAVVILWFLVLDFAAGDPFHTPARLAGSVLGEEFAGAWPRLVAVYTVLHFGVFLLLGVAAGFFLRAVDVIPGIIPALVFGAVILNVVHYAGLLVAGAELLTIVPVVHVIGSNLVGAVLMMFVLRKAWGADQAVARATLDRDTLLFESLAAGLVGASAVASWFFIIDIISREPFHTPAVLGSAILLGATSTSETQATVGVISAYTLLHIAAFWVAGFFFVWLARQANRDKGFWLPGLAVLVLLEGLFLGSASIVGAWLVVSLGWITILGANVLAVLSMGVWIWRRQNRLSEGA